MSARAFEWFKDNVNITITEDIAVSEENTAPLQEYLDGIKEAREVVTRASKMVDEMCNELDSLKLRAVIPIKLNNDGLFENIINGINSISSRTLDLFSYGIDIEGATE